MDNNKLYIAGIGASADGILSLKKFFENIGPDTGIAFVVILHLPRDYESHLPAILSRYTTMPVAKLDRAMTALPNHVYVLPGRLKVDIHGGILVPTPRPEEQKINRTIDDFFHSLATDQKENAIAIVLSGSSIDGAHGAGEIHKNKGLVLVEHPTEAGFTMMPSAAIAQNQPTLIADTAELARSLTRWSKANPLNDRYKRISDPSLDPDQSKISEK